MSPKIVPGFALEVDLEAKIVPVSPQKGHGVHDIDEERKECNATKLTP